MVNAITLSRSIIIFLKIAVFIQSGKTQRRTTTTTVKSTVTVRKPTPTVSDVFTQSAETQRGATTTTARSRDTVRTPTTTLADGLRLELTLGTVTSNSISVSWAAGYRTEAYEYQVRLHLNSTERYNDITANSFISFGSLLPKTLYTITVQAITTTGSTRGRLGQPSNISAVTLCEQTPPVEGLFGEPASYDSIKIKWQSSITLCNGIEYRVICKDSVQKVIHDFLTATLGSTIGALEADSVYSVSVMTYSRSTSLYGRQARITVNSGPGRVEKLEVRDVKFTSIMVSWVALAPKTSVQIRLYEVAFSDSKSEIVAFNTSNNSHRLRGLQAGTTYSITVRPIGESSTSAIYGQPNSISAATCHNPGRVDDLSAKSVRHNSVAISWKTPKQWCVVPPRYTVRYSWDRSTKSLPETSNDSVTIYSLNSSTTYVIAVNTKFEEDYQYILSGVESSINVTTGPNQILGLRPDRVTDNCIYVTWYWPYGSVSVTQYELKAYSYLLPTKGTTVPEAATTYKELCNLQSEANYTVEVSAVVRYTGYLAYGAPTSISVATDCTEPKPVENLRMTTSTDQSIIITWSRPSNRCQGLRYEVNVTTKGSLILSNRTNATELKAVNLEAFALYDMSVQAINIDGLQRESRSSSRSISTRTGSGAPAGVDFNTTSTTTSIFVEWYSPSKWLGEPGGYIITLKNNNETEISSIRKNAFTLSHTFYDLTPSTTYQILIIPYNHEFNGSTAARYAITDTEVSVSGSATSEVIGTATGLSILAVVLVAVLAVGLRRRNACKPQGQEGQELKTYTAAISGRTPAKLRKSTPDGDSSTLIDEAPPLSCDGSAYENLQPASIAISALPQLVLSEFNRDLPFLEEFQKLPTGPASLQTVGQAPENKKRNKFKDIIPYDHNRVVLTPASGKSQSDYINASYIEGYGKKPMHYIAAQGPINDCVGDFWRMVLEVRSEVIVMVTRLCEAGVVKCARYWPEEGCENYGDVSVTLVSSEDFPDYQINILQIAENDHLCAGNQKPLTVKHFYFAGWPDHGVPEYSLSLLRFRRNVASFAGCLSTPTIVHCSAGVGRTGTYIAIDYLLKEAENTGRVQVQQCVQLLRAQRPRMVQTREQYAFVYRAVMEGTQAGDTSIPCERFSSGYKTLTDGNALKLNAQYQVFLNAIQPIPNGKCSAAMQSENVKKNVDMAILPADSRRPILITRSSSRGSSDYINAVFLDAYKKKNAFIVTQLPLLHTIGDFWRLVFDYHVTTLVSLDKLSEKSAATRYWPEVGEDFLLSKPIEARCITSSSRGSSRAHRTRDFQVTRPGSDDTWTVRQFEYLDWPSSKHCPSEETSFLELIASVEKWAAQTVNGLILVHCRNGAEKCGLFVAAANVLQGVETEQHVDVYLTSLLVRQNRPQMLCNLDQYSYLYSLAATFMETFDTYSNFLPRMGSS